MSESLNRFTTKAARIWKRPEALVGLCILVAYLLVWPVGEYTIEDDWAFSLTLRNLHANGELRILDWIPMTLVTHLFTGLLFTKILGFHLTLLKITTVLLLAVEAWAIMALLRRLGVGEGVIAMAGLTLVFNPLHFFQSFLYATDIPALAWSSLALLFYARGLEEDAGKGYRWFWLGSVFASLAWGVRQSAVFVVGALFFYLLLYGRDRLKSLHFWAASFLLPTLSVVGFQAWYQNVHGPTGSYLQYSSSIRQALGNLSLLGSAETLFLLAIYAGFFVLPMALGFARSGGKGWRSPGVIAGSLVSIFLAALFFWASFGRAIRFPYLRNKITQFGFLSPNEIVLGAREVLWGSAVGWTISVLLCVAAIVLVFQLTRGLLENLLRPSPTHDEPPGAGPKRAILRLVFLLLILQVGYSFLTLPILFDRHLLLLLPTALVLLVAIQGRPASFRRALFVPCLLVLAGYSIAGTHDLHAISRTAFRAGEELMEEGVDAQFIDAGFAFDGWYMFERAQQELAAGHPPVRRITPTVQDAWYIQNLMPRILTRYIVSLSPVMNTDEWEGALAPWTRGASLGPRFEAHDVRTTYSYRTYWPWKSATLYSARRSGAGGGSRSMSPMSMMNGAAERYVRLVLALGRHDPDYVDAYTGPPAWREEVDSTPQSLEEIRKKAGELEGTLAALPTPSKEIEVQRHAYLQAQLRALMARAEFLSGTHLSFDEETRVLYDATAPSFSDDHFEAVLEELEPLLPGSEPLSKRYANFKERFVIPTERLDAVFLAALNVSRERTSLRISLPAEENFTIEYVKDKAWSGYNWYHGGYHSLIQINTDLPIGIDRAIDLACHEGYPGHHVYNVLFEKNLVRDRGWVEFSVYPLFSPHALISEGTANFGIEVCFPGSEKIAFEAAVLYPLAGLDPERASAYRKVLDIAGKLSYAGNEVARSYLDGKTDRETAVQRLARFSLMTPDRAEQRMRFIEQYRSYVINYNLGKALVRRHIESRGGTVDQPERRWEEFGRLLTSPRLPSGLAG